MQTRRLRWEDLKVTIVKSYNHHARQYEVWKCSNGKTKVHASLVGCSFVMKTFWMMDPDLDKLETRQFILLNIQRAIKTKIDALQAYISHTSEPDNCVGGETQDTNQ